MEISVNDEIEWIHFYNNELIFQNLIDADIISILQRNNSFMAQEVDVEEVSQRFSNFDERNCSVSQKILKCQNPSISYKYN